MGERRGASLPHRLLSPAWLLIPQSWSFSVRPRQLYIIVWTQSFLGLAVLSPSRPVVALPFVRCDISRIRIYRVLLCCRCSFSFLSVRTPPHPHHTRNDMYYCNGPLAGVGLTALWIPTPTRLRGFSAPKSLAPSTFRKRCAESGLDKMMISLNVRIRCNTELGSVCAQLALLPLCLLPIFALFTQPLSQTLPI